MYNLKFSFNFFIAQWVKQKDFFDINHEFVKQNIDKIEFLRIRYDEIKNSLSPKYPLYPFGIIQKFNNWRDLVIDWFNKHFNPEIEFVKPLYLVGNSNSGKTYFIDGILSILKRNSECNI